MRRYILDIKFMIGVSIKPNFLNLIIMAGGC